MSSLFSTFNTIKNSMGAEQYAVNTTAHNIANVNTEGYSRQRVLFEASNPEVGTSLNSSSGPGQLGTGVDVKDITRARDIFLDSQIRNELSSLGEYNSKYEILSEVETIFMEPSDKGLSSNMSKMWNMWNSLANNPQNSTYRTNVVQSALTLTDQINHTYSQIDSLKEHSKSLVQGEVFELNDAVSQIEKLNVQIRGIKISKNNPNDLLDKQDLMIDKISDMVGINVNRNDLGVVTITSTDTSGGITTILGENKESLSYIKTLSDNKDGTYSVTYYNKGDITAAPTTALISKDDYEKLNKINIIWTDDNGKIMYDGASVKTASLNVGSIDGYSSVVNELEKYQEQLNILSRAITVSVNTMQNDGKKPGDAGYVPFFTSTKDTTIIDGNDLKCEDNMGAYNITVNPNIIDDPMIINARAGENDPLGNGDRALATAQLRDTDMLMNEFDNENYNRNDNSVVNSYIKYDMSNPLSMKIADNPKGTTISAYFGETIAKLGSSSSQAKNVVSGQNALVSQLQTRKDSISGVSMDEEMANLIQYQQAYQASAKAFSIITELIDTVVNGLIK